MGRCGGRYADGQRRFGTYGVLETEDGAVVRHFEDVALDDLPAGFEMLVSHYSPLLASATVESRAGAYRFSRPRAASS